MYAVHQKKIEEFLTNLSLWDSFQNGDISCYFCKETITFDNLGLIIPYENDVILCCSNYECFSKYKVLKGKKKIED